MSRFVKLTLLVLGIAAGGAMVASAFSLLGKYDTWQVERIGYNLPSDIGGPMNVGEEYRWNIPVITYGFDESFINYFGTNGMLAVEKAMQILNDLPPASQITDEMIAADTSIFPPYVISENAQAAALRVADMKSATLHAMLEQLGLAEPERFVYTLRSRTTFSNPDWTNWVVIQRNFDPVTFEPTNRINDTFYTWNGIIEVKSPFDYDYPRVVQLTPEPNAGTVAGGNIGGRAGFYYPGTNAASALTRDDVGGLRYLLRPSNLNVERLALGTEEVFTNTLSPVFMTNYSLTMLLQETRGTTNTVARVLELFPGLEITGTNTYLTNIITTNITSFFTNFPYQLGAELEQVYVTNYVPSIVQLFDYEVGNIVTNPTQVFFFVNEVGYEIAPATTYTPGGSQLVTNWLYTNSFLSNTFTFYIRPTNAIDLLVLSNAFSSILSTTNTIATSISELIARTNDNVISLTTQDYYEFIKNTRNTTNTLAQVLALYPDLLVTSSNSSIGVITQTNITSKIINYPWAPEQVFETQYVHTVVTNYDYTVGNVVLDSGCFTSRPITVHEYVISPASSYTPGVPTYATNDIAGPYDDEEINEDCVFGEFFIVPTNLVGFALSQHILTTVTNSTNVDFFAIADMVVITNNNPWDPLDLLETHDLFTFSEQARTNSPQELLAIYPELLILSSNRFFTNEIVTNYVSYFTNSAWDPAGTLVITNMPILSTNIVTNYNYTFGNVVTNDSRFSAPLSSNGFLIVEEHIIATPPYTPAGGPPTTNITISRIETNMPVGNVYIVPTNLFGFELHPEYPVQLVDVVAITNTSIFTNFFFGVEQTNTVHYIRYETNFWLNVYPIAILSSNEVSTNIFGHRRDIITYVTNNTYEVYPIELVSTNDLATNLFGTRHERITYFTNSILAAYPIEARPPTYNVGLRGGVDKITFVRVDYDSLTGTNQLRLTNTYIDTVIISNVPVSQTVRRVRTAPDILFLAADLGTTQGQPVFMRRTGTDSWENNDADNGNASLAGPGVIHPSVTISFSKVGPYYDFDNFGNQFLQQTSPLYRWGSFDSSTNIIVFPEGTSIQDIEQQIQTP